MCGSIPAPLNSAATMPSNVGSSGGGAAAANAAAANTANASATATGGGDKATGGGPDASKLPVNGGGAADGAANLQLQQTLTSLVQALTALTELLKNMPASGVAGANGAGTLAGGPETKGGGPETKAGGPETKGGGPDSKVGGQTGGPVVQQNNPLQVSQYDPTQGGGCVIAPPPYIPSLPGGAAPNFTSGGGSSADGHNHTH